MRLFFIGILSLLLGNIRQAFAQEGAAIALERPADLASLRFFFDTGAGLGGKKEMQLTTLKNLSIGPFHFRQIPTYIFDDPIGQPIIHSLPG